jgi:hypothetical protein
MATIRLSASHIPLQRVSEHAALLVESPLHTLSVAKAIAPNCINSIRKSAYLENLLDCDYLQNWFYPEIIFSSE